jgi:hypothetical protein
MNINDLIQKRLLNFKNNEKYAHISSIICKKNINIGQNSTITDLRICNHAEIDALRKYFNNKKTNKFSKKINLTVIRISKTGKLCDSRPCLDCCLKLQKHVNVKNIFYSTNDQTIIKIKFNKYCRDVSHISKGNIYRKKN